MFQCLPFWWLLCLGCGWWWYCCWCCWCCCWRWWRWCWWLYEVLRLFCWVLAGWPACLCLSLLLFVTDGTTGTRRHELFSPARGDTKNDVWPPPPPWTPWTPTPEGWQSTSTSKTVTDRKPHNICIPSAGLTDYVFCKKFIIEWDFATFSRNTLPLYKIIYLIYSETILKSKISSDLKCKALKAS